MRVLILVAATVLLVSGLVAYFLLRIRRAEQQAKAAEQRAHDAQQVAAEAQRRQAETEPLLRDIERRMSAYEGIDFLAEEELASGEAAPELYRNNHENVIPLRRPRGALALLAPAALLGLAMHKAEENPGNFLAAFAGIVSAAAVASLLALPPDNQGPPVALPDAPRATTTAVVPPPSSETTPPAPTTTTPAPSPPTDDPVEGPGSPPEGAPIARPVANAGNGDANTGTQSAPGPVGGDGASGPDFGSPPPDDDGEQPGAPEPEPSPPPEEPEPRPAFCNDGIRADLSPAADVCLLG